MIAVKDDKKKKRKLADLLRRRRVSNSASSVDSDLSEDELEAEDTDNSNFESEDEDSDAIYFSESGEDSDSGSDVVVEEIRAEEPSQIDLVESCQVTRSGSFYLTGYAGIT